MAKFTLEFEMDNAAFADGNAAHECVTILLNLADRIEAGSSEGYIYDSNGNKIGNWGPGNGN